jgi:hypothetical protein
MIQSNEKPDEIYVQLNATFYIRDRLTGINAPIGYGTQYRWLQKDVTKTGCASCGGAKDYTIYLIPDLKLCMEDMNNIYWYQTTDGTGETYHVNVGIGLTTEVPLSSVHRKQPTGTVFNENRGTDVDISVPEYKRPANQKKWYENRNFNG